MHIYETVGIASCILRVDPVMRWCRIVSAVSAGIPVTDDGDWDDHQTERVFSESEAGQFPVRFLGRLNVNYGYPFPIFCIPDSSI